MSAAFTVNLGIKDLQRKLADISKYDTATQAKLRSAVQTSTANVMVGSKRRVPVKTGNLVKKISMTYDGEKNVGKVEAKTYYAHFVEFGAKAAVVKPKIKKELDIAGNPRSMAHVPARKEHPFLRPAFEDEKPNLIKSVNEAIKP